jgi:hypothetical protein
MAVYTKALVRSLWILSLVLGLSLMSSPIQADCFDAIRGVSASAEASLRKDPKPQPDQFSRGKRRAVSQQESGGLFDHIVDRVEISSATESFLNHQKAFSKLNIRVPGLSRAQVKKAYEVRLKELRTELFDPRTRLSEDIADLKRDIEALEEAYQELVQAGLAD